MNNAAMGSTGGLSRTAGNIVRHGAKFQNLLKTVDEWHLDAVRKELSGTATGWDHVTEMRNSMNGLRNIVRSMTGMLKDPNLSAEHRQAAEALRRQATDALGKARDAFRR